MVWSLRHPDLFVYSDVSGRQQKEGLDVSTIRYYLDTKQNKKICGVEEWIKIYFKEWNDSLLVCKILKFCTLHYSLPVNIMQFNYSIYI